MTLIKVCTRSNEIPRRRRGGFEFSTTPRTIDVDAAQEKLIRADDALIVVAIKGEDIAAATELAAELTAHESTRAALEKVTRERDAAFARLAEHGHDHADLAAPAEPEPVPTRRTVSSEEFDGARDFGAPASDADRVRSRNKPPRGG